MRALLAQLQNDLVPTKVAYTEVRLLPEKQPIAAEPEGKSPPRLPFSLVDASFGGASSDFTLRLRRHVFTRPGPNPDVRLTYPQWQFM